MVNCWWWANSLPRSQVSERVRCSGRRWITHVSAATTTAVSLLTTAIRIVKRAVRPSTVNSALMPVTCARRSAVSAVTPRFSRTISFSRGKDTPSWIANADCERPSGLRNSSSRISPGCTGGTVVGNRRLSSDRVGAVRLLVVRDFDVVRRELLPAKAGTILWIDANAVLALAITAEPLQSIARRNREFAPLEHAIQLRELAADHRPERRRTRGAQPAIGISAMIAAPRIWRSETRRGVILQPQRLRSGASAQAPARQLQRSVAAP